MEVDGGGARLPCRGRWRWEIDDEEEDDEEQEDEEDEEEDDDEEQEDEEEDDDDVEEENDDDRSRHATSRTSSMFVICPEIAPTATSSANVSFG